MKTKYFLRNIAVASLALHLAAVARAADTNAPAADKPEAEKPAADKPADGVGNRVSPTMRVNPADRANGILTDEQRMSLRAALVEQQVKMKEIDTKLREARRELFALGLTTSFDEAVVREKAMAAAKLDAELSVLRTRAFTKIQPPLSDDQKEKLKQANLALTSVPTDMGLRRNSGAQMQMREPSTQPTQPPRDDNNLPPKQ